jgi:hypothetical protein
MRKHFDEIVGSTIGGTTGLVTSGFYDWVQTIALTIVCSLIGLLVSHFGKRLLKKLKW